MISAVWLASVCRKPSGKNACVTHAVVRNKIIATFLPTICGKMFCDHDCFASLRKVFSRISRHNAWRETVSLLHRTKNFSQVLQLTTTLFALKIHTSFGQQASQNFFCQGYKNLACEPRERVLYIEAKKKRINNRPQWPPPPVLNARFRKT